MVSLAAICEGKTERLFCGQLLKPHLAGFGIDLDPIEIGVDCKQSGGNVSFSRVMHDAELLLSDHAYVTTLVDFFRLGDGWSGVGSIKEGMPSAEQAEIVESAACKDAGAILGSEANRFLPNVLMHEFEALLFTDPNAIVDMTYARSALADLLNVSAGFPTPEDINTGRETAPSKRLVKLGANYGKIAHGARIAAKIGLTAIRAKCPHFNSWLACLEKIGAHS